MMPVGADYQSASTEHKNTIQMQTLRTLLTGLFMATASMSMAQVTVSTSQLNGTKWIIKGDTSGDFDEYTMKEVYDALQIGRYYNDSLVSFNMDDIFTMSEDALRKKVSTMSESVKRSAIIRANDKIKDGSLDSIKKVKLLEEVLGCELTSPED